MGMEWIQVDARLHDRPELVYLACETGESFNEVAGRLVRFWGWFERYAKDGRIRRLTARTLGRAFGGDETFWTLASQPPCDFLGIDENGLTSGSVGKYYAVSSRQRAFMGLDGDTQAIINEHYRQRRIEASAVTSSPKLRTLIMERDGARCRWCHETEGLALDHILPVAAGGTDDPENLQLLCGSCNSSKGDRVPSQFKEV